MEEIKAKMSAEKDYEVVWEEPQPVPIDVEVNLKYDFDQRRHR